MCKCTQSEIAMQYEMQIHMDEQKKNLLKLKLNAFSLLFIIIFLFNMASECIIIIICVHHLIIILLQFGKYIIFYTRNQ